MNPRSRRALTQALFVLVLPTLAAFGGGEEGQPGPVVTVAAIDDDVFAKPSVTSGVSANAVLRITAHGFVGDTDGIVRQCVIVGGQPSRCHNAFPIRFDEVGRATFQYLLSDADGCEVGRPACIVEAVGSDARTAITQVLVGDAIQTGRLLVHPAEGLTDGQTVTVEVSAYPPGSVLDLLICRPPGPIDDRACAPATGARATITVGDDGDGSTEMTLLFPAELGCGRHRGCAIAAVSDALPFHAPVALISLQAGPTVTYGVGRLTLGLAAAGILAVGASWLVLSTDWRKPIEADTPSLDAVELDL